MKSFILSTISFAPMAFAGLNSMATNIQNFCLDMDDEGNCRNDMRAFNTGGSSSLTNSINSLDEYGCWCYFDNNHGRGKAQPVDAIDELCKILHDGYECAMRDAEDEGTTCIPWEVQYDAGIGGSPLDLEGQCRQDNPGNNCAIRACVIEGTFIANLLDVFVSGGKIEPSHRHNNGFGFNPETECIVKKNGGGPANKECCGQYPERFPFKTVGGDRKCCGNRTYNSLTLKCCNQDTSTVKFNC